MENLDVAALLDELADLLEIKGVDRFRVRAYRTAVHTIETLPRRLTDLVEAGVPLTDLPGIGKDISRAILEILETGSLQRLNELWEEIPRSVVQLVKVGGLGPKRAKKLWDELQIESIEMLEAEIKAGRVAKVAGFGERTAEKLLKAIEAHRAQGGRFLTAEIEPVVATLVRFVLEAPGVLEVEPAGSYRRLRDTLGDVDLLARCDEDGAPVVAHFIRFPGALDVEAAGGTKGSVRLRSGLKVDLRVVPTESWGAALHYFTGSKEHNVQVRMLAVKKGLRINEWGVYRPTANTAPPGKRKKVGNRTNGGSKGPGDDRTRTVSKPTVVDEGQVTSEDADESEFGERVGGATEEEVFGALGLAWIPPELRENRGEIEAARKGELPSLLVDEDIKGDLQMHSTWSDGKHSIEEMALACKERGYQYLAITDHSQSLTMTNGLDPARLRSQWEEIEEVRSRLKGILLLRSQEIDILKDGSLDMPDDILEELDLVVVSVHSFMGLDEAEQTKRVIRALEHPHVDVLAHPTGRIIGRRPPYGLNMEAVLQAAAVHDVAVEMNATPYRSDLSDVHAFRARELGIKVAINTDAHSVRGLGMMSWGVEQGRRAWLEKGDVLNAMPAKAFQKWLKRKD
jgi:DNA polymerase (family 10)